MMTNFEVVGPRLRLRLAVPEDAEFIHALRTNPRYNQYLSSITGTAEDQRAWIDKYKAREVAGIEYYFIIERQDDGCPCGTVRLYDLTEDQFTWGSWILDHNKPPKAALESALLSFDIGFGTLGLETAIVYVEADNSHAEAFYRRFGMIESCQTEREVTFLYTRRQFEVDKVVHLSALEEVE